MNAVHRLRAILKYGRKTNIPRMLVLAKAVYTKMLASPTLFANPSPALATLDDKISALDTAQDAVNNKIPKAAGVRDAARDALMTVLEGLRTFVQTIADAAPPEQARVIIEAAGMAVATVRPPAKPALAAKLGVPAGVVLLVANARLLGKGKTRSKTYGWEYTVDGGKTWLSAPSTPVAHTSISGLPSLTVCGFRVNVSDAVSATEWSQTVTILVH